MSVSQEGKWQCHYTDCKVASDGRERSYSEAELLNFECSHIQSAKSTSKIGNQKSTVTLLPNVLSHAPFPPAIIAEFKGFESTNKLIHHISEHSFVVQTAPNAEAPLGLLHIRIDTKKKFHCSCSKFKRMTALSGAPTAPKVSKRCVHVYICLWAILSSDSLKNELQIDVQLEGNSCLVDSYYLLLFFIDVGNPGNDSKEQFTSSSEGISLTYLITSFAVSAYLDLLLCRSWK